VNIEGEEIDEEANSKESEGNELYRDLNVNLEGRDVKMTDVQPTNVQTTQITEDTHVIITLVIPEGQQQSSSMSSGFVSNMLNPSPDIVPTPATVLSSSLQDLPNFGSLFGFNHRLKTLETDFSEFKQMNHFAEAVSSIPGIVNAYIANKMHEAVKTVVQLQSERLRDEAQAKNADFLNKLNDNIKKIIKDQVKEQVKAQVSKILPKIEKTVNEQLEAEVMTRLSTKSKTSLAIAANLSELELKKILIEKMESNKSIYRSDEQKNLYKALVDAYESDKLILDTYGDTGSKRRRAGKEPESTSTPKEKTPKSTEGSKFLHKSAGESAHAKEPMHTAKDLEEPAHQEFETGATEDQPVDETPQPSDWFQKPTRLPSLDRDWNKTLPTDHGPVQPWLSNLAREEGPRESFDELMDTPLDLSAFMMNRLKVDTLTPELLAGLTFELMNGTCKSLVELEYFFEEVYKATTDQLDWKNPEVSQAVLMQLPLQRPKLQIMVISNRLKIWSPIQYGVKESARDVYSKRKIIAVTKLQIVEWHGCKHLDWITVRRDDDKIYTFKEGDFKQIRLLNIEDMLILLVQGKLTNLNVEDRLAFGVSLGMFTRSIVIQRRVEDLQLGVESFQKKLNITKPDTYRSDLKRRDVYTAYSNPKGFIYQNKDKKNKLMCIDELHKFSDGTLDDVRTALNDRLKRIRIEYLPETIWRQSDRERAKAMIQAIKKMLKSRRIIRSLERFVGGRPTRPKPHNKYEAHFNDIYNKSLQKTAIQLVAKAIQNALANDSIRAYYKRILVHDDDLEAMDLKCKDINSDLDLRSVQDSQEAKTEFSQSLSDSLSLKSVEHQEAKRVSSENQGQPPRKQGNNETIFQSNVGYRCVAYYGLDEFKEPEFKGYGPENSKQESNIVCDKKSDDSKENSDNSLVESVKPKNHEKPVKKSVRYAEMYRSQTPRGNQRNWNGQKSNQLGSDFVMYYKACFICGSFNHVQAQCKYHQRERMVYGSNYNRVNYNYTTKRTHPNAQRNMVPRAVLMKTSLKTFNTAKTVNTAHPKSIVFSAKPMSCFPKIAQSTVRRPFQSKTTLSNKRFTHKVNTAKAQAVNTARPQAVNTARPKIVKTARPNSAVVNVVRVNQANVVNASACWFCKPTKPNSAFHSP
ncbi:hypothetical protein Tco_1066704, partial [Tanacetum coccineum]